MPDAARRTFAARLAAAVGLAVSYGLLSAYGVAFLFPPRPRRRRARLFVGRRADLSPGTTRPFVDQRGRNLLIVVRGTGLEAFDTRCPHLGCRVRWEPERQRFVCPCHQGVFDADGVAVAGPPAAAGQSLARARLEVDAASGTVFVAAEG